MEGFADVGLLMSIDDTELGVHHENLCPRCSLNIDFDPLSVVVQRYAANARERSRTTSVNVAFSALRTCIPTEPRNRKLSKVETLRLACSYIGHLANTIRAREEGDFGGQVCQRYGYVFANRADTPGQKHICTFCLTDSRRNHQQLCARLKEKKAIDGFRMLQKSSIHPQSEDKSSHSPSKSEISQNGQNVVNLKCYRCGQNSVKRELEEFNAST